MSRQSRRPAPQLSSRVPAVIAGPNSQEEQRLRLSLAQLEQQRVSQEASDTAWLRSFAVRQTLHLQSLHRLGFTRSLDLLPDCLLTNYGDSLMSVAKQPLLGRIAALSQQQKRLKRERDGVKRSVSLGDGKSLLSDKDGGLEDVSQTRSGSLSADETGTSAGFPSLSSSMVSQPMGGGLALQRGKSDKSDQPMRGGQALQRGESDKSDQPMRNEPAFIQPIRRGEAPQPIRAQPIRLPQLDPRFLSLVSSLERKSAWKRRYVPPQARPSGAETGNSLEELVNSYYSK